MLWKAAAILGVAIVATPAKAQEAEQDLPDPLTGALERLKRYEERIRALEAEVSTLNEQMERYDERLPALEAEVSRLKEKIIKSPKGKEYEIALWNEEIGDGEWHYCPEGSVITALRASEGIRGKFGVDGIRELSAKCTKLFD